MISNPNPPWKYHVDPAQRERESIEYPEHLVARCPGQKFLYSPTVEGIYDLLEQERIDPCNVLIEYIEPFDAASVGLQHVTIVNAAPDRNKS